MTFDDIHEARRWFLDYKELDKQTDDTIINFWYKYDFKNWRFGDYILFQHIENNSSHSVTGIPIVSLSIGRPQYAIFTSFTIWDQALVMQFVESKRAWMHFTDIVTNKESGYKMPMSTLDDEVEAIQFWTDNIHVLGHWKAKPNLSELKIALKNKIIPLKESREGKLIDILK